MYTCTLTSPAVLILATVAQASGVPLEGELLSHRLDRVAFSAQGWGELGIDVCAHQPGQAGLPLKIGEKSYEAGLGHHAPGQLIVDLNGEYDRFTADVGIQPLPDCKGTVIFKVFVDDRLAYESGILSGGEPARSISIDVSGASELRLEAMDGGDGMGCDCANWAAARLIPAALPLSRPIPPRLDVAPFARVVTSDPARITGCTAGRTEEYRAEDVFLDTDLQPDSSGGYAVPTGADGRGVIGLRWLERRSLRELVLEFPEGHGPRRTDGVQIQYWAGESAWQGQWQPLEATIRREADVWRASAEWQRTRALGEGTRRIRWIFPPDISAGLRVRKLRALSATPLLEAKLRVECDPLVLGDAGRGTRPSTIGLYNGEFVEPAGRGTPPHILWNHRTGEPLILRLRAARPRPHKPDRTVLQFRLPNGAFGVAIDDVLEHGQVYVKAFGVLVARAEDGPAMATYRRQIVKRETLLEEVRRAPDQTFAQAIEKVHNPAQNLGPTMLSLACENHKFVVHRDGRVQFAADPSRPLDMGLYPPKNLLEMRVQLGSGRSQGLTRRLEGGWTPIVLNESREGSLVYRQRVYVVPMDGAPLPEPGWISDRPACVVELSAENTGGTATDAAFHLSFSSPGRNDVPRLRRQGDRVLAAWGERLSACIDLDEFREARVELQDAALSLAGSVPAGRRAGCIVYLPGWMMEVPRQSELAGGTKLVERVRPYWEHVLAPAVQIELPDELLTRVIRASQVHCLMAARSEAQGQRVAPWIASFHYGPIESEGNSIIRGMDWLGHHEFARRAHDFFLHRYNEAGFLTTGYTVMGTGWHLWTLGEHYELTRDRAWLQEAAPQLARVCEWILRQREKTRRLDALGQKPPEFGLMPPGVMADWNAYAYHFCLNAYYCAALRSAGTMLGDLGHPDAGRFLQEAAAFREDIVRAYRWTQARMPAYLLRDGTAVAGYPSQVHSPGPLNHFFPGEDANRSWCYDVELGPHHLVPLGIFDPDSRDVTWMMNHHEDVQFLADGWFDFPAERNRADPYHLGGFAKVQPYYCRNAEIYAMRDDLRPFIRSYFNTIPSLLNFENLSFQEHFAGQAAWNKTHETGYFLHQTRLMLLRETEKDLWLAPFATSPWMRDGAVISVQNAPGRYGPLSFRIVSHAGQGRIEAVITPPRRSSPETILLRLRHPEGKPMKAVFVDGRPHQDFDPARECVRLRPAGETIEVKAQY